MCTELYDKALQPWLDSFLQGFNVTVIAYGQTGSGKTFTMGNSMPSSEMIASHLFARSSSTETSGAPVSRAETTDELKADDGLIPRFLYQLFERLNTAGKDEHQVSVSFLEIYGEEIHDLLQNSKQNNDSALESLQLREGRGGVYVQGLTEVRMRYLPVSLHILHLTRAYPLSRTGESRDSRWRHGADEGWVAATHYREDGDERAFQSISRRVHDQGRSASEPGRKGQPAASKGVQRDSSRATTEDSSVKH